MGNDHCKYCGGFCRYGEFCSKECKHKWYIKYGEKEENQSSMEKFFK
jgi:hypothetical protein